jgi:hypothetical protein
MQILQSSFEFLSDLLGRVHGNALRDAREARWKVSISMCQSQKWVFCSIAVRVDETAREKLRL